LTGGNGGSLRSGEKGGRIKGFRDRKGRKGPEKRRMESWFLPHSKSSMATDEGWTGRSMLMESELDQQDREE